MLKLNILNCGKLDLNFEKSLTQKIFVNKISTWIEYLMYLGFEYSFQIPTILTLESFKNFFYTGVFLKINELLKLNFKSKECYILNQNKQINSNTSWFIFKLNKFLKKTSFLPISLHLMTAAGAKANLNQIIQLIGIRGYLTDIQNIPHKYPVLNNFSKGLNFFEYFISCKGTRKGILDTALKTADSGYLTKRLIESTQNILIKEYNCGKPNTLYLCSFTNYKGSFSASIYYNLLGKKLENNLINISNKCLLYSKGNFINKELLLKLKKTNFCTKIKFRTIKLCMLNRCFCVCCSGYTNIYEKTVGTSTGILTGQTVGEPGTQLVLRTFHTGGVYNQLNFMNNKFSTKNKFLHKNLFFKLLSMCKKKYYRYTYKKCFLNLKSYKMLNLNIINKSVLIFKNFMPNIFFKSYLLKNNFSYFNKFNCNINNQFNIFFSVKKSINLLLKGFLQKWIIISLINMIVFNKQKICINLLNKKIFIKYSINRRVINLKLILIKYFLFTNFFIPIKFLKIYE